MAAQLHISIATEPRIDIEEFIEIDDNFIVCALVTEEEIFAVAESDNRTAGEENEDDQATITQQHYSSTKICYFNEAFNTDV